MRISGMLSTFPAHETFGFQPVDGIECWGHMAALLASLVHRTEEDGIPLRRGEGLKISKGEIVHFPKTKIHPRIVFGHT